MRGSADVGLGVPWGPIALVVTIALSVLVYRAHGPLDQRRVAGMLPAQEAVVEPLPPCPAGPVALTFDDGPSRDNSARLLALLARHEVPATMFVTGRMVRELPDAVRRFARAGHRIHNHTYDHVDLTSVSDAEIHRQLRHTDRALRDAGVDAGRLLRPPFGSSNERVRQAVRAIGYEHIKWTVDTRDWRDATTRRDITDAVDQGLERGAVILLHDVNGADATVAALPRVIAMVRERGHCFGVLNDRGRVIRARPPRATA
jgi:peptidoglycan/xylan/chitin deacetylase (PgdA/CDA1 family)